jgi:chromosome segregation ATPase
MQQEQENNEFRSQLLEEKRKMAINEAEMLREQGAKLNVFVSQLTAENEKLIDDRDNLRKDTTTSLTELSSLREQLSEVNRNLRVTQEELNEKTHLVEEMQSMNNNADSFVSEENMQLRDANGRLKISYSKLKTDYTQIVDDLR